MSDCSTRAWRCKRTWHDQEWHDPMPSPRREVAGVPAIDVTYRFKHGLRPLSHTVPGQGEGGAVREVECSEGDGARYVPAPVRDWDEGGMD